MTIPVAVVRAYVRMMPALRAEESLLAVDRSAVGLVALEPASRDRILGDWYRQSDPWRGLAPASSSSSGPPPPVRRVRMSPGFPIRRVVVDRG